jgi:dolichol-phosphate mannosyltransferase
MKKRLILVPTYNELENSERLCNEILELKIDKTDILFIDDNSPDGTGKLLDKISQKNRKVKVVHRLGKLGIGSAHLDGIIWAYKHGYNEIVSMDCDFTHSPTDIPKIIEASPGYDVVVGSRYLQKKSLVGWNIHRKILTLAGHLVTKVLLGMNYDASGAFRLYKLDNIPVELFSLVDSRGYSFFLESLYILDLNGFKIGQIPIKLPPRTYGHSKMKLKDVFTSADRIMSLFFKSVFNEDGLKIQDNLLKHPSLGSEDVKYWDKYWEGNGLKNRRFIYDIIASFYRRYLIKPSFNYFVRKYFKRGSKVLHAGCGGGEVDIDMQNYLDITALDFSQNALNKYQKTNGKKSIVVKGDVRHIPFEMSSFDGVYNFGLMEHFSKKDIGKILKEFYRVIKPEGMLVIFWPPEFGLSVMFFKFLIFVTKRVFITKKIVFHPPEISRLQSENQAREIFEALNFKVIECYFGIRDLFTYSIIVAQKR